MTIDKETATLLIDTLHRVGFPIVVACWYMWRTDKRLEKQTAVLQRLANLLAKVVKEEESEVVADEDEPEAP